MSTKKVKQLKETAEQTRERVAAELAAAELAVQQQIEAEKKIIDDAQNAIEAVAANCPEKVFIGVLITPDLLKDILEMMLQTGENVRIAAMVYFDEEN
jgi:hypothetical protein